MKKPTPPTPKPAPATGLVPLERLVEAYDTGAPLLKPMLAAEAALSAKDETSEATQALAFVESVQVTNPEEFAVAVQMTAEIKAQRAKIESVRKSFVGPLNNVVTSINAFFRPAIAAYDAAEQHLKQRALQWRAEAEAERERLLQEAEEQAQGGDVEAAEETIAVAVTSVIPTVKNFSAREAWTGEVVDASKIPREYLTPDLAKLEAHTKAVKGDPKIPGWRAFKSTSAVVRQK